MVQGAERLLTRLKAYTAPTLDTRYATHGLHPYPAKFIPQIPAEIIREHTNERHIVFDPFCGSGTTLVEAMLHGRRSIGCDSNPVAALISRAKTTPLSEAALASLRTLIDAVHAQKPKAIPKRAIPSEPRLRDWFEDHVIKELAWLKSTIDGLSEPHARQFALCVFSSIIVAVSNQESDTRYAAIDKGLKPGDALGRFYSKLQKSLMAAGTLKDLGPSLRLVPTVFCSDLRKLNARAVRSNTADLVVTSPPYPNSYDYYLYHKWRMVWLGQDFRTAQETEIGSRNEHSSRKAPISAFEEKMKVALANVSRILKPSKLAYFLVGDSVIDGQLIDAEESLKRITFGSNLRFVESVSYPLSSITRSFREKASRRCHGGARNSSKQQRILVFESVRIGKKFVAVGQKSASSKASLSTQTLSGIIRPGSRIAIKASDKNRHVHSLARYPSKFVPAVPGWAIDTFTKPSDLIVDPFCGSGTTNVEALIRSRSVVGVDVSPFACLATRGKTIRVKESVLLRDARKLATALDRPSKLPAARRLEFDLDSFWFNRNHLTEFARIRTFIEDEITPACRDFFLLCLASTIRKFSFQDEAQIKVKRDGRKVVSGTEGPRTLLQASIDRSVARACTFLEMADNSVSSVVQNKSADGFTLKSSADAIITSPPYINAMNYPMTHRYENVLLGLVDATKIREHEKKYFGTERVSADQYNTLRQVPEAWSCSRDLNTRLEKIFSLEKKRSFIAYQYFVQMNKAITHSVKALSDGGHFVLVAGRNTIKGIPVPTFEYLVAMLADLGLKRVTEFDYEIYNQALKITRHRTGDVIKYDGVAVLAKV